MSLIVTGVNPSSKEQKLPEKVLFANCTTGKFAEYFFKNNPWKLSIHNDDQNFFRFCVTCGDNRFSDEKWSGLIDIDGPPTICDKDYCWDARKYMSVSICEKHCLTNREDRAHAKSLKENESFEKIESVVRTYQDDRIYDHDSKIPEAYFKTFKMLEEMPIDMRISEIDSLMFKYAKEHNMGIGPFDYRDPYLKALQAYRILCCHKIQFSK